MGKMNRSKNWMVHSLLLAVLLVFVMAQASPAFAGTGAVTTWGGGYPTPQPVPLPAGRFGQGRVHRVQAIREGLVEALHAAGATWFPPSTGSNQAYNMGAMTANEAMISTHARNFPGRNGNTEAKMFLASAATVAASAVTGRITDPRQFLK